MPDNEAVLNIQCFVRMDIPMRTVFRCPEDCRDIMDVRVSRDAFHDGCAYALVSTIWRILMMITTSDHMLHGTLTLTNVSEHVVHRSSDGMEMIHAAMAAMLSTSYAHVACVIVALHMYMCQWRLLHTWF